PEPAEVFDWRDAPPPVQPTAETAPLPALPAAGNGPPLGVPVPPPREPSPRPRRRRESDVPIAKPAPASAAWDDEEPKRRSGWVLLVLTLLVAGMLSYGGWRVVEHFAFAEENLRTEAEKDYQGGAYRNAAKKYHELAENYGRSPRAAEYRFW